MHTDLEPFVDADEIAALLDVSRRHVIRMAREGKLTAYLMSGIQRHTYKFRRSEVIRDIEKLRHPPLSVLHRPMPRQKEQEIESTISA